MLLRTAHAVSPLVLCDSVIITSLLSTMDDDNNHPCAAHLCTSHRLCALHGKKIVLVEKMNKSDIGSNIFKPKIFEERMVKQWKKIENEERWVISWLPWQANYLGLQFYREHLAISAKERPLDLVKPTWPLTNASTCVEGCIND